MSVVLINLIIITILESHCPYICSVLTAPIFVMPIPSCFIIFGLENQLTPPVKNFEIVLFVVESGSKYRLEDLIIIIAIGSESVGYVKNQRFNNLTPAPPKN